MSALIEPFFYCLVASMIWAPIVFIATTHLRKDDAPGLAEKIWPTSLVIAALPALIAPVAAAFGLSLRSAPPLPPMGAAGPAPQIITETAPIIAAPTTISLTSLLDALAVLYFYGFMMFLILGVARYIWFSYRVGYAFEIDEPRLEAGLEQWRARIGIKRRPRYAFSDAVASVCVHGIFRPVILMPHNLLDRVSINDAVLMGAHEMAHIKRGDTSLFAFCTVVKAVFWFNPFMQRIAARANLAAEQAADALVIARGVDRRQYAHCFVQGLRFAAGAHSSSGRELVPSFTPFDKRSRRERLDAILSGTGSASLLGLRGKIGLAFSIGAAAALAFAQAALAVAPPLPKDALPQPPVQGKVSFGFGQKSAVLGDDSKTHKGVDIKARRGTIVQAAGDGKVIAATSRYQGKRAWGKVVVIDHGHGLVTRYAHLDSYRVKKGDRVKAGNVIGAVGSTGKSTGPHLHFEVIQDGEQIDPAPVIAVAKPMPAPDPVLAPVPNVDPVIKSTRAITISPAPSIAASPKAVTKVTPHDRVDDKLEGRFENLGERLAETFQDFDAFDDFEGFDFDNFDNFDDFEVDLDDFDVDRFADMQVYAMNGIEAVRDIEMLSKEDRAAIRETQRKAIRAAGQAMHQAKREVERARQQALKEQERVRRHAERAERDIVRAKEQLQRNHERAMQERERAETERERAAEDIERAREAAGEERERVAEELERARGRIEEEAINREEMLALREEALADARADLEEELAEVERMRAELEREKRAHKDD